MQDLKNASPDIELINVSKSFSSHPVLKGVSMKVMPETVHVLLGLSGSGKSVTLKVILRLIEEDVGDVLIRGQSLAKMSSFELQETRSLFGMLFQQSALFDSLDVFENIAFPMREHRRNWTEEQISEKVKKLLSHVELDHAIHKMPADLSGGMRKRVGLARAMALEPKILLFDEPTTGLDPVTSQVIDDLILRTTRSQKASALIISHNILAALRMADFVSMIGDGIIIESAPPGEFVKSKHPKVRQLLECAGVL